jgi:TolB-like protein/Tfp pilus assembly protein PilF
VITVYASASFVLIELVNNLAEPLNLPARLSTIVVVVLAVGFPLAVIVAWIYDLTPDGIEKTKTEESAGDEQAKVPNAWRIATYISFVVILGLLTQNILGGKSELKAGDIQSLVILPFDNFTGDDGLEYFVSGMHASLVGDMGQLGGLQVTSRTSSSAFKYEEMTLSEIALALGTDAALETAVMCLGDTICLQFRLVGTKGDEEQLWVAEYREEKSQILNLYNRITKQIAEEVIVELSADEQRRLDKVQTVNKEAYEAYLQGYELWKNPGKLDQAEEYLSLAIDKDPEWAPPYAGLAQVWILRLQYGLEEPGLARQMVHDYISRATELDPDFRGFYFVSGIISTWTDWAWEKGEKDFLKAIAVNPSDVMSRIYYAHLLICIRRPDEALTQGKLAVALDPLNPFILGLYSGVLRSTGQFREALEYAEKALALGQVKTSAQYKLALMALGEYDKAWEHRLIAISRHFSEELVEAIDRIYKEQGYHAADKEIVRQFELLAQERYVPYNILAARHYASGAYSKALDDLEKGYELHEPFMPYIVAGQNGYPNLYDSTRFIGIVKKMNLPIPKN